VPDLVAIAAPPGPRFVAGLTRAWDDGHAVLPVDPRLPVPAVAALLEAMRPAVLVDETGEHQAVSQPGGPRPVEVGDAIVVATSGTTGEPKGVVLTHDAVRASAMAVGQRLGVDPARDRWLAVIPVAHVGGLSVVTRALASGTPLTFDWDDPDATLVSVVPTQLERHDVSRFRVVLAGGSADWRAGERPPNVVHTYGLTETGSGVAYDGVPLDGVDVRIDAESAIWVRGPMLLRAYRDGTDPKDADGWLATGDAGKWDAHGRLVVHGRLDDAIVTGGEKVWPSPVEAVLAGVPGVADVAVGGVPDPEWGERVVAYVVPAAGRPAPELGALREAVSAVLPAYAAPRGVVVVAELPRTATGKLRRPLFRPPPVDG
jgi:O-succinylbenzoic acid--CoA ligase